MCISIISFDHFNIAFNYYVFIFCISFDLFDIKENLNACNFLNNDLIFNPLALLDLSQSPLCISTISFNHFDIAFSYYVFIFCIFFDLFDIKENLNACNFLNNDPIFNPLALLDLSQSPLCISTISFDHFNIAFNYYVFIFCIFFDLFDIKENLNACNFLNNDLIFNPLALLDLSQSPLCISTISFNHFDIAFSYYVFIFCIFFDLFDIKENLNACNFLNNDLIFNPLALLDLSQSPLCISTISFNHFDIAFSYYVFIFCIFLTFLT